MVPTRSSCKSSSPVRYRHPHPRRVSIASASRRALIRTCVRLLVTAPVLCFATRPVLGQDIQPYLADDVVGIAAVDLDAIDVQAVLNQFGPLVRLSDDPLEQRQQLELAAGVQWQINRFRQFGVRHAYLLLRPGDVKYGAPAWVLPVAADGQPQQVVNMLKQLLPGEAAANGQPLPTEFVAADRYVLAASSPEQLKGLQQSRRDAREARPEVRAALSQLNNRSAGVVLFGNADSRRVIRELFPQLPAPFETINGSLIADGIRWAAVLLDLPPNFQLQMIVQTSDNATAETIELAADNALEMAQALLRADMAASPEKALDGVAEMLRMLDPAVDDARLSLTFGGNPEETAAIGKLLAAPIGAARQESRRTQRSNKFRQIALALQAYQDSHKTFPAAAIYDENGQPLLSWRVALLPFLDQQAQYDSFRLNEPWDSEHNRKLISLMPDVYADPDPAVRRTAGEGRTTFVMPSGENTLLADREGMSIKEITDGTSATVLAVEVTPERAVIWTKPDDWRVDWNDPLDGVRREDGRPFTSVRCDASVHVIHNTVDPAEWAKMLTPAGGELAN